MKIQEGTMPFKGYETYYRIVGECTGNKKPIILLHGGPGSGHDYFEMLDDLALDGRAVISYDQLGCGKSKVFDRPDLFNKETWIEELIALRKHLNLDECHLLGQSWGGMMEIIYAIDYKPKGIHSLTLSSTLSSASLYASEQHRMISYLPQKEIDAIQKAEETNDFSSKEVLEAIDHYMNLHCCNTNNPNDPECLRRKKDCGSEAYITGWGPNEFTPSGNLKDYEYTSQLNEIKIPTLVLSGTDDLSTPLVSKTLFDGIPNAKWHLFKNSRHMCFVDQNEEYKKVLLKFLNEND